MKTILSVENLSKSYKLGQIGTGTFSRDIEIWWARRRGKPNPFLKIGQTDDASLEGETLWALRDVSFEVQQGEVLGIIGRNGAGKSTLLKILSRVTAPTSGLVKVKGRIASLLEVGTGFHPELTGRENIYLNGAILGMSKEEVRQKFDEIVAFAEIEKFIDTPVKRYSSGMYVRLAFAVAAHLESEILLVDEVLAVGDAEFQRKCLGKMGDVASKEGRTVLFVSHNMAAINSICSSGMLISNGNVTQQENIDLVISNYLSSNNNNEGIIELEGQFNNNSGITKVYLIDKTGKATNSIPMAQPFGFKVQFKATYLIKSPTLGIRIKTLQGNTIIGITSYMQNKGKLADDVKEGEFRVLFPQPNLNQGTYMVTFTLGDGMISIDRKNDVLQFNVTPFDIFGTGKIPTADQASVFAYSEWSFKQISEVDGDRKNPIFLEQNENA